MDRKQLAEKLNISSYHIDEMFWDMIEVDKLLLFINENQRKPDVVISCKTCKWEVGELQSPCAYCGGEYGVYNQYEPKNSL